MFEIRYWSYPRILFAVFYILCCVGVLYCGYETFTTPKIPADVKVYHKDSGVTSSGEVKYFVEGAELKDTTKMSRYEIQYGFVWDTIKVSHVVTIQKIPLKSYWFGLGGFFLTCLVGWFSKLFGKLVLRIRD